MPPYEEFKQAEKARKQAPITDKTKGLVESWCKNVRTWNEDMQKGINTLSNLKDGHEIGGNGGGAVTSNYMIIIINRLQKDVEDLFKICQLTMVLDVKKSVRNSKENEDQWTIMRKNIKDELNRVDIALNQTSYEDRLKEGYVQISRLLNMRDIIQKQIMFSCLYRKLLVWNDLNIHPGEYCEEKVVECSKILNDYQEKLGYMPTKMQYEKVSLDQQGYFSPESDGKSCESTDTFEQMVDSFINMEDLIKKNFLMVQNSPDKITEFNANNPVQQTLREKVQDISQKFDTLQAELKQMR